MVGLACRFSEPCPNVLQTLLARRAGLFERSRRDLWLGIIMHVEAHLPVWAPEVTSTCTRLEWRCRGTQLCQDPPSARRAPPSLAQVPRPIARDLCRNMIHTNPRSAGGFPPSCQTAVPLAQRSLPRPLGRKPRAVIPAASPPRHGPHGVRVLGRAVSLLTPAAASGKRRAAHQVGVRPGTTARRRAFARGQSFPAARRGRNPRPQIWVAVANRRRRESRQVPAHTRG